PLESLTPVYFNIESDYGRQLLQLFRNCPSLTRLKLSHHEFCPVTELSKTILEFYPNLESIHYRNVPKYNDPLPEGNAETMLRASGRWLHVNTYVSCVSAEFCMTFISHAGWLETLVLYYCGFGKDHEGNSRNISRILANCNHLRTVRVIDRENAVDRPVHGWSGSRRSVLGPVRISKFSYSKGSQLDMVFRRREKNLVGPILFHNSEDKAFLEAIASSVS
ncbi:hypothetical protein BG005_003512, partial [Podila minutissima]